ncbi:MAG: hypothetical protein ACK5V3_10725 [Bdellovibrionales bacterium]
MGNFRQILAGAALFFLLALAFWKSNSLSIQAQGTSEDYEKDKLATNQIQNSNQKIRDVAQAEEKTLGAPRSHYKSKLIEVFPAQPRQIDLKEIEIQDIKDSWKLWQNKRAVLPQDSSIVDSSQSSQIQKVGNYLLFDSADKNHRLDDFSLEQPWVVFNERLNTVGVLTGTISLQLHNPENWESLQEQFNLRLIHGFPEVGLFLVTAMNQRFDLLNTYELLKSNSQVQKAELEIVSRQYVQ